MANLKAIRRRITSVTSTQKITRAMKMVAAARLRKAQEAVEKFRAYADLTEQVLAEVASGASAEDHPLLERREPSRSVVLTLTSDKGLCGAFNSSLCRDVMRHMGALKGDRAVAVIGKKGVDFFGHRDVQIDQKYPGVWEELGYAVAATLARELSKRYASGELDSIDLAFNEFVSMISQRPVFKRLLPVVLPEREEECGEPIVGPAGFIFEPDRKELLGKLLPKYIEVQVFRALLESNAAEQAARMTAMDAATNNAAEMIDHLTLIYNRARQSAITNELMDIVGGAEALQD